MFISLTMLKTQLGTYVGETIPLASNQIPSVLYCKDNVSEYSYCPGGTFEVGCR